jgi:hypothetical protein
MATLYYVSQTRWGLSELRATRDSLIVRWVWAWLPKDRTHLYLKGVRAPSQPNSPTFRLMTISSPNTSFQNSLASLNKQDLKKGRANHTKADKPFLIFKRVETNQSMIIRTSPPQGIRVSPLLNYSLRNKNQFYLSGHQLIKSHHP